MPFSVSTCLTGLGTVTLGPTLTIYSNPISPTNQGVFVGNVATSLITGGACPYTFVVPDGTTTVRLFDPVTFCYADIPVSDNNVCSTCNLTFTSISNNLLSTINVGSLAGTCDPAITDYRINWYGPNNSTLLAFTSGAGTIWPVRDATQPITSTSLDAPFLQPGTYVSKITEVELNNTRFSYIGGANNVLSPSLLNCSYTVSVSPYTCLNGVNPPIDNYYAHQKEYVTDGSSPPKSGSATISLGAGTQSLIWAFTAFGIYDTLKLTFNGSSYPNPIVLEDLRLGGVGNNTLPTTFPKLVNSYGEFKKITKLTNLTVNNNDTILIEVTPNPNPAYATSWKLKFGCFGSTPASKTCLDDYKNKPYKIQKSSIIPGTPNTCGVVSIYLNMSGCSPSDNTLFIDSDLVKLTSGLNDNTTGFDNVTKLRGFRADFSPAVNSVVTDNTSTSSTCTSSGANTRTITISKSNVNEFTIFCSNQSDILAFESSFIDRKNAAINMGNIPYTPNDTTNINYYRFMYLQFFTNIGNYSCGDGNTAKRWWLHCSSTYTLNTTVGGYLMTIQTPLIPNDYPCNSCTPGCGDITQKITGSEGANTFRNSTFSFTNTSGLRYTSPWFYSRGYYTSTSAEVKVAEFIGPIEFNPKYATNTYASTSDGLNTLLPSLSATSWDWENHFAEVASPGNPFYKQEVYKYKIVVVTFTPLRFQLFGAPISNFLAGAYDPTPIYDSLSPNSYNSTYIYV